MSDAPPVQDLTVPQLVGVLENDERACAWAGTIEVPAAIAELKRRAADPTSLGQEEAEAALSRLDLGAAPVEQDQGLQARVLLLLERTVDDSLAGRNFYERAAHAATVEAYARAAVHLAGLEAIHAGQVVGQAARSGGGYSATAVSSAVWEEASKALESSDAEALLKRVLARLEGEEV